MRPKTTLRDRLDSLWEHYRMLSQRTVDDAIRCEDVTDYERAMGKSLAFSEAADMLRTVINSMEEKI
jgi:hypothetical protein